MINNPLDANNYLAQLQQSSGAQLSGYKQSVQDAIAKSVLTGSDKSGFSAVNAYPDTPTLKFDDNAGFSEGVGNGISNYMALKNYRTKTEMLNQAVLQDRAEKQHQTDMLAATAKANTERRAAGRGKLKPAVQELFDVSSPDQQDKLINTQGDKTQESSIKIDTDQEKLNWQRERFHALTGAFPEQIFAQGNQGALTPQVQSAWRYVYDADPPKDALDLKKRFAEVGSSVEAYKGAKTDNETRGQRNQASLDGTLLGNKKAEVDAKYEDSLRLIDKLTGENKLEEASDLKKRLVEGKPLYEDALTKYDHLTPGQVKALNSRFKSMSLPFELPEKEDDKLKPITVKGNVTGFTDSHGHVFDADGKPKG